MYLEIFHVIKQYYSNKPTLGYNVVLVVVPVDVAGVDVESAHQVHVEGHYARVPVQRDVLV